MGNANSPLEFSKADANGGAPSNSRRLKTPEQLQIRAHGEAGRTAIVYLPGMHGDWTLIPSFRARAKEHFRFVEFTYPRTTTWSLDDYADAIQDALASNGITRGWLLAESWGSQPAELPEFLARRTEEDRRAAVHRLALMRANDLRPLAAAATIPVHALSGAVDPVVPWPPVFRWLKQHCPGFRGSKVVWNADHNVLNSVRSSADCVFNWIWKERLLCLAP